MSRTNVVIALAGVTLIVGAAGCALGMLAAPASGTELRRRLAWRADEEWKGLSRAGRAFMNRVVSRAGEELERRQAQVRETLAAG